MESLFSYIAESLLCGALFLILFYLLVSGKSSYNFQRGFLILASLFSSVFPIINIPIAVGSSFLSTLPEITVVSNGRVQTGNLIGNTGSEGGSFFSILFFSVFALFFLMFVIQMAKLLFVFLKGEKIRQEENTIILSNLVSTPYSFFNLIFINSSTDEEEKRCIISHERAHSERYHSIDIIVISIITSMQWFNPFIYMFKGSLVSIHEYQADKDVIKSGYSISYYRNLMLGSLFGVTPFMANSLNNSLTIKRLKKMENLNEKRNRLITVFSVVVVTFALFFVVSCKNTNQGGEAEPTTQAVIEQTPVEKPAADLKDAEKREIPFTVVEVKPKFNGMDENQFTKWVMSQLKYPDEAKAKGIEGRVIAQFLVNEEGVVTDVKIVRGVDKLLDLEAYRVISMSPKWTPGSQNGEKVCVRYTFPVIFKLK